MSRRERGHQEPSAAGRVLTTKDALNQTTTYEYDPNCGCSGRRTRVVDALGNATSFAYDQNGNQTSFTDANGHTTSYEYDLNNRQTKVRFHDGSEQTTIYDALGRRTSATDQAGKTTRFEYDKLGRLVKVIDALNQETRYGYDEIGNRTAQIDALNRPTSYEYDKLGRRVKRILPLGQTETYSYNSVGNLTSRSDFNGKVTSFSYDILNRLLTKTPDASFGQAPVAYAYTVTGRRASMTDPSGTTSYSYDNRDRLTSKQTPQGTLSYTYNAVGNLLTVRSSNANGVSIDYGYDALNRLKTVTDNRLGATQNVTTYGYDNVGNLSSVRQPNGVESSYTYNSLNRLTNLTVTKGAANLASYAYTLGPAGNRLSVAELSGRTVSYAYDALYRLTNETIAGAGSTSQNGSISYSYDAVGNRLNRTSTAAAVTSQQNITYDNNDRLNSDQYDANGNTVGSDGKVYSYDSDNRLVSVSGNGTNIAIIYNGDGDWVAKIVNGVRTDYLVDNLNHTGYAQIVEELQGSSVVRQYSYGHDLISQRQLINGNWAVSYFGYDGHGSVRFLTDSNGTVTDAYNYDAFGNLIEQTGTTPNLYLYAGEQWDPDLGLYFNRARYLNTGTGRFWTQDSYEGDKYNSLSLNKYNYVNGNPISNIDPSGNFAVEFAISSSIALVISNIPTLQLRPVIAGFQNNQQKVLTQALDDVRQILSVGGECSQFFDGFGFRTPAQGIGLQAFNSINFTTGALVDSKTGNPDVATGIKMAVPAGIPTNGLYRVPSKAEINLNGGFFTSQVFSARIGRPLPVPNFGPYSPNTRRVRILMVLHEVAHTIYIGQANGQEVWLIPNDGGNTGLSIQNTNQVLQFCRPEIDAFPN